MISNHEHPSAQLVYGIAVSNLNNEPNPGYGLPDNLPALFEKCTHAQIGVELQLESIDFGNITTSGLARPPFIGLHLPIKNVDLQNSYLRDESRYSNLQIFSLAQRLKADYVVVHMLTHEEWDRLYERDYMIYQAKQDFASLAEEAVQNGFSGKIIFENLEFPLYPATCQEIVDCNQWLRDLGNQHSIQTAFALDFGHLWHTGSMLDINRHKAHIQQHLQDPFVNLQVTFEQYLEALPQSVIDDICLLHLANSRGHYTHLMPDISDSPPVTGHQALGLESSLKLIVDRLAGRGPIWAINEAHHHSYDEMIAAMLQIRDAIR